MPDFTPGFGEGFGFQLLHGGCGEDKIDPRLPRLTDVEAISADAVSDGGLEGVRWELSDLWIGVQRGMRSPSWSMLTDAQRSDYVRSAFSNARKQGRGEMIARHPEIGAGVVPKGMPPLPPGYRAGSPSPVALSGLRGAGLPPLPPGYSVAR